MTKYEKKAYETKEYDKVHDQMYTTDNYLNLVSSENSVRKISVCDVLVRSCTFWCGVLPQEYGRLEFDGMVCGVPEYDILASCGLEYDGSECDVQVYYLAYSYVSMSWLV